MAYALVKMETCTFLEVLNSFKHVLKYVVTSTVRQYPLYLQQKEAYKDIVDLTSIVSSNLHKHCKKESLKEFVKMVNNAMQKLASENPDYLKSV